MKYSKYYFEYYALLSLIKCFGYKYFTPFIPFDKNEIQDSIIKTTSYNNKRNKTLTNNIRRGNKIWKK